MSQYDGTGSSMPTLSDTRVDNLSEGNSGVIDELPALRIDIPDSQIIQNLENRINDSKAYWNEPMGFDLENVRTDNIKLYEGKHIDVRSLYKFQTPYVENQIYVAQQAIKAYLTASPSQPEVAPSSDSPQAKQFASDAEKLLLAHGLKKRVRLQQQEENAVHNAMNKRVGLFYYYFDPNAGKDGEIIVKSLNPSDCVVDKNVYQGGNAAFFCRYLKMPVNEACGRWADMANEIHKELGIAISPRSVNGEQKRNEQLDQILDIREVWLTYYDKKFEAHEAVVYYFGKLVLEKDRNPNWLYASPERNFLDEPTKPIIALNFDNDGEHYIDNTSSTEQAGKIQFILNKRGRQLMELVDKANGVLVIDTFVTGISMTDSQDLTRDPNQVVVIDTSHAANKSGQEGIFELPAAEVPDIIFTDKQDLRVQVHAMMGTPSQFTGIASSDNDNPETLGQSDMKKDQAAGRQDLYVRAIDRFMEEHYNMVYQMMIVWYDQKRYERYNGGDGEFDFLVASRDILDPKVVIQVKSGTTLPFDKKRQETVAMYLLKNEAISLLDAYKLLHMQSPQQLYDNWAKQKVDPMALARDALDDVDETKAYVAYTEIMAGKEADSPDDCTKEFVLTLKKCMIRDDFLKSKDTKAKTAFLKFYEKALASLQVRTELDIMGKEGLQLLAPNQPLQPLPPPVMQPPSGMPGSPPMGQPGIPPQLPGMMPPPQGQPPMNPGMPPRGMQSPQPMQSAVPNMGQAPQLTLQ